jgi:ABC-type multidrug transport system ATPase subunit
LLSSLAHRIDRFRMNVEGEVLMNGQHYTIHQLKKMAGYVMQDDLIHSHLTVGETVQYTAELRMDRHSTAAQRTERENYVLNLLGISYCRDTIVGDTRHKGISGGERKRLCIAMELITNPALLFLDEPTSGLDSATAYAVVATLNQLALRGECTIVTTIHQPQAKIFALFDNLILMRCGEIAYQGSANKASAYFKQLGYPCPPETNIADHLIDVLCDNPAGDHILSEDEKHQKALRIAHMNKNKFVIPLEQDYGGTASSFHVREVQPWFKQFFVLFRRSIYFHTRNWYIFAMNMFVTVIIALFVSLNVWQDIGDTKASVPKRQPLLFFCVIHQGIVASLQGSHSFPLDRAIMLRERAAGAYYVSAYFLAKTLADMVAQVPAPIIFTCIVYPLTGLQLTATQFFRFMMFMILESFSATSVANAISCIFVSIELSTVCLALAYEWVRLFGGWFISPAQIELYPDWRFADVLSYIKYAFVGVSLNENDGLVLHCTSSELNSAGMCVMPPLTNYSPPFTGAKFNDYYGYDQFTIAYCAVALVIYILSCRIAAYLALRYIKV